MGQGIYNTQIIDNQWCTVCVLANSAYKNVNTYKTSTRIGTIKINKLCPGKPAEMGQF